MITCKLSGCSFLVRQNGSKVECAHVRPEGTTGTDPQRTLTTAGAGTGQMIYGGLQYDPNLRSVTILGVRRGGRWKIYAQKHQAGTWSILSVHRIFGED